MKVDCPSCGKGLRVKDESAGKRVKCPACGNAVTVPASSHPATGPTGAIAVGELEVVAVYRAHLEEVWKAVTEWLDGASAFEVRSKDRNGLKVTFRMKTSGTLVTVAVSAQGSTTAVAVAHDFSQASTNALAKEFGADIPMLKNRTPAEAVAISTNAMLLAILDVKFRRSGGGCLGALLLLF